MTAGLSILVYVAQLNLYLNEDTAADLKRRANRAGISISAFVARELAPKTESRGWPKDYFERRCGFLREDIHIESLPAEPVDF